MKFSSLLLLGLLFIGCKEKANKVINETPVESTFFSQHLISKLKNFYDTVTVVNRENRIYIFNTPENKTYITALYFKKHKEDIPSKHLLSIDLGSCIVSVDFGLERYINYNIETEKQQDLRIDDRVVKAVSFYDSLGQFVVLRKAILPSVEPIKIKPIKLDSLDFTD